MCKLIWNTQHQLDIFLTMVCQYHALVWRSITYELRTFAYELRSFAYRLRTLHACSAPLGSAMRIYRAPTAWYMPSDCTAIFYTPVWKTDVLCRGNVRPSVRPSVRPRFPDFSWTCFEISIWNLVYTFSRWHNMSSLSCITIGSLWPSLQPKVGQTHFLQSWPHKSR